MLFDPISKRITITQTSYMNVYAPTFESESTVYAYCFDDVLTVGQKQLYLETFDDNVVVTGVKINTPSIDISKKIKAYVDQVVIDSLIYTLNPAIV